MPSCCGISLRCIRPVMRCSLVAATWASIMCMPAVSFTRGRFIWGPSCAKAQKASKAAARATDCFMRLLWGGNKNARARRAWSDGDQDSVLVLFGDLPCLLRLLFGLHFCLDFLLLGF